MEAESRVENERAGEVDLKYEYSAPHYFDFCKEETAEEATAAERWFQPPFSYAASPFVGKLKAIRELSSGCSLEEYIGVQKLVERVSSEVSKDMQSEAICSIGLTSAHTTPEGMTMPSMLHSVGIKDSKRPTIVPDPQSDEVKDEPCTPREQVAQRFIELKSCKSTATEPMKRGYEDSQIVDLKTNVKRPRTLLPRSTKPAGAKRCLAPNQKDTADTKKANKRRKLEGGQSCHVWNKKTSMPPPKFPHPKPLPTLTVPQEFHFNTQRRAQVYKETGQCSSTAQNEGFRSVAEMVQRFELGHYNTQPVNQNNAASRRRKLGLTYPKEPILGTSLRARPTMVKSFVEQEEEFLANLPKFKARPLNKKILEGPTLPMLPRSTPQLPEFQVFNLRTMERALMHQHTFLSREVASAREKCLPSEGAFHLYTAARVRPSRIKSSKELEEEELARMPKFKARPVNKRIFSSKGDVGVFPAPKRQATVPKEFHFATDDRAQYHNTCLTDQTNKHATRNPTEQQLRYIADMDKITSRVSYVNPAPLPLLERPTSRKPLTDIQQFVFGGEARNAQHEQLDRKYLEKRNPQGGVQNFNPATQENSSAFWHAESRAMYTPQLSFHTSLLHDNVPMRSAKEHLQQLTPHQSTPRLPLAMDYETPQKQSFPVCYMR